MGLFTYGKLRGGKIKIGNEVYLDGILDNCVEFPSFSSSNEKEGFLDFYTYACDLKFFNLKNDKRLFSLVMNIILKDVTTEDESLGELIMEDCKVTSIGIVEGIKKSSKVKICIKCDNWDFNNVEKEKVEKK